MDIGVEGEAVVDDEMRGLAVSWLLTLTMTVAMTECSVADAVVKQ